MRKWWKSLLVAAVLAVAPILSTAAPSQWTLAQPAMARPVERSKSALTLKTERPAYRVGETPAASGKLTRENGTPMSGATISVMLDSDTEHRVDVVTGDDGTWSAEIQFQPGRDQLGDHSFTADFPGNAALQPGQASAQFLLTGTISAVNLQVDPHPDPVYPGGQVNLRGTLHSAPDNAPLADKNVYVCDPEGKPLEFGWTNGKGEWQIIFTVPAQAGTQVATFPRYPASVHFDGDLILGSAQQPLELTLGAKEAPPTPTPSPFPPQASRELSDPPKPTASAAAYPKNHAGSSLIPGLTRGHLLLGGAIVIAVFGAALVSHGIRRRSG